MFDRTGNLNGCQIIAYRASQDMKWFSVVGIAAGDPSRPGLVKGKMQLFSKELGRSQELDAHACAFSTHQVTGNSVKSQVIAFAQKTVMPDGNVASKLHVIELGAQAGQTPFQKRQAELFFPPEFMDDFPVNMSISEKYGVIYVVTKMGLLFVYDLETATAIYRNKVSNDPVFLACDSPSTGGVYAVNRRGQVLLLNLNEPAVVPFISGQLNNVNLALQVAVRGGLPGAESLVKPKFEQLFAAGDIKGAAECAADSPKGILRNPETIARFKSIPGQPGAAPPRGSCSRRTRSSCWTRGWQRTRSSAPRSSETFSSLLTPRWHSACTSRRRPTPRLSPRSPRAGSLRRWASTARWRTTSPTTPTCCSRRSCQTPRVR